MSKNSLLEGFAYGAINEILAGFRDQTSGDYARPSRYEVIITPPVGFAPNDSPLVRKVSMEVTQVSFPGYNLEIKEDVNVYGPVRKIVQGESFAELTSLVRVSPNMAEKTFFEQWQKLMVNNRDFSVGYYDEYIGSMQIFQLDREDRRRYGVELLECYPVALDEQQLDYSTTNAISTIAVTWNYRYWKNLEFDDDVPAPLVDRIGDVFINTVERQIRSRIPKVLRKLGE